MPYRFVPIGSGSSQEDMLAAINNAFAQLDGEAVTKVFKGAGGSNAFIEGRLPNNLGSGFILYDTDGVPLVACYVDSDGNPILKTSKQGYDATTTDAAHLTFDNTKSFVVVASGTYTFPDASIGAGSTAFATSSVIPHGAGFVPAISCYAILEQPGVALPVFPPDFPTDLITFIPNGGLIYQTSALYGQVYYGVNDTNIYLGYAYINDTGATTTVKGAAVTYYAYSYSASV